MVLDVVLEGEKMLFMNHFGEVEELDCTTNSSNVIMNNSSFVRIIILFLLTFKYITVIWKYMYMSERQVL